MQTTYSNAKEVGKCSARKMLEEILNLPQRKVPEQALKLQKKQTHMEHVIAQEEVHQTARKNSLS